MTEHQHIEWKESWRDEYLKWIAGFANAQGGVLVIGKNDAGEVVGVADAKRLPVDLPNKVRDVLGIVVAVNLHTHQMGDEALDTQAFKTFRQLAAKSGRLDSASLAESDVLLIDKLHLTEGRYLKRAATLLFHADPQKFTTGAYVKIGFFGTNVDLLYHDVIEGHLFNQIDRTFDLLLTKYLRAGISYQGSQRYERFPVPEAALREALINAIAHKDYGSGIPIQISVYADKLMIWNPGQLPADWSLDRLLAKHASQPANPDIANTLFLAGNIESWGRGIELIRGACATEGGPAPLKTPMEILQCLQAEPTMTLAEVATAISKSLSAVARASAKLVKDGKLRHVGPQKGGHWEVLK